MIYSQYEILCSMFLSHKLAAESNKVGAISFNIFGKGVVGITLENGEHKTFTEYSEARDWCINKGVKYVVKLISVVCPCCNGFFNASAFNYQVNDNFSLTFCSYSCSEKYTVKHLQSLIDEGKSFVEIAEGI